MDYKILGDSDCPLVHISLREAESVKVERGSMAYITNVELEGKFNSNKKGIGDILVSAFGDILSLDVTPD